MCERILNNGLQVNENDVYRKDPCYCALYGGPCKVHVGLGHNSKIQAYDTSYDHLHVKTVVIVKRNWTVNNVQPKHNMFIF